MVNFLETIISVLPNTQKAAIKSLIAAKIAAGELSSIRSRQQEASDIYNRIRAKLGKEVISPRYAIEGEKISSSDCNRNLEEAFIDLNSLYSSIDRLSKKTKNQGVSLDNSYIKSQATIQKLINDVRVYGLQKQKPEFNDVRLFDFNSSANASKKVPKADVSFDVRLLQLKPLSKVRIHLSDRTTRNTKIYTKTYSQGIKGDMSISFPVENMVDQKPETFWATAILADAPVSQVYEKGTATGGLQQVGIDGPVVEICFKFSHTERINNIKILPFSEFPITILDVAYKSVASAQIFTPIKQFEQTNGLDWEEINFAAVTADEVKITIAQENYKQSSYLLPRGLVKGTELFNRILKQRASKIYSNYVFDSDLMLYALQTRNSVDSALDVLEELYKVHNVDITVDPVMQYHNEVSEVLKLAYSEITPFQIKEVTSQYSADSIGQENQPLIKVNKFEYLLGIREVEINYVTYYPTSYYESEKMEPQATVSQIQIEVDEEHVEAETSFQTDYRKTSIEWEVDIGEGRRLPIHPINIMDDVDTIPSVKEEVLSFDLASRTAYTRLGGYYSTIYKLKKNGNLIPSEDYSSVRVVGSIPRLKITLSENTPNSESVIDINSVYTVDYAVDPSSYSIDILDKFNSKLIDTPDVFTEVGSDNEITLSKYPYVDYSVINLPAYFQKDSEISSWSFITPQADLFSGQLTIEPKISDNVGNISQVGNITGDLITGFWGTQSGSAPPDLTGDPEISLDYFGESNGIQFGYYLKVMDSNIYAQLDRFVDHDTFELTSPISVTDSQISRWESLASGLVFGGPLTGTVTGALTVDYRIGVGILTDGKPFVLNNIAYTPLTVEVGGREAKNITNYETLVHPAFNLSSTRDSNIEYIQAGNKIYFNQPITNKEIRVNYNWLTSYVSVIGVLKFNGAFNPNLSPKVNQIRVFMNNLVI
jgi:hypothetical protein